MKFPRKIWPAAMVITGGATALFWTGCSNPFITKYKVLVDAISAPGAVKPSGQSYRLVAKRSAISQVPEQVPVIAACVNAALGGQGMFEAPANVPSDLFIEVSYGMESTPRVDPQARETFLQLSARSNPEKSLDWATGPELWDVRVAVMGVGGQIEQAMPLLSSVAANYLATDTRLETQMDVPQNSPMIAAVRESAVKTLEGKAAAAKAAAPVPTLRPPPTAADTK